MCCGLLTGQMRGWKFWIVLDTDEEGVAGPSTKKAQAASLKRGSEVEELWEWQERVVDALEVVNMKCQAARTQLAVVARAIKYIAEAVYHHFVVGQEDSDGSERGP